MSLRHCSCVVAGQPQPPETPVSPGEPRVATGEGCRLNLSGVAFRIEIRVHPEDVSGAIVRRGHRRQDDVALVFPLKPVDRIVLTIDTNLETLDVEGGKTPLPIRKECQALLVEESDALVKDLWCHVGGLADAPKRHLPGEHAEDRRVFCRIEAAWQSG